MTTSTDDADDDVADAIARIEVVEHALRRLVTRYGLHGRLTRTSDGGLDLRINPLPPRRPPEP